VIFSSTRGLIFPVGVSEANPPLTEWRSRSWATWPRAASTRRVPHAVARPCARYVPQRLRSRAQVQKAGADAIRAAERTISGATKTDDPEGKRLMDDFKLAKDCIHGMRSARSLALRTRGVQRALKRGGTLARPVRRDWPAGRRAQ
jgi:hypothetical protein